MVFNLVSHSYAKITACCYRYKMINVHLYSLGIHACYLGSNVLTLLIEVAPCVFSKELLKRNKVA